MKILLDNIVKILQAENVSQKAIDAVKEYIENYPVIINEDNLKNDLIEAIETRLERKITKEELDDLDDYGLVSECMENMLDKIEEEAIFYTDEKILK